MKRSEYARHRGIRYKTAWRWWHAGKLDAYQAVSGTIIVREATSAATPRSDARQVAIYARVSFVENRPNLERQADRLVASSPTAPRRATRYTTSLKEIGSGVNDSRPKFLKLLADPTITLIVVEHKDRATRFGFRYLETLLEPQGRRIEAVNLADDGREDLVADLVDIVYSFCARLYGQRRAKRKTESLVNALTGEEGADASR